MPLRIGQTQEDRLPELAMGATWRIVAVRVSIGESGDHRGDSGKWLILKRESTLRWFA
jgi:hypothetical protein